MATNLKNSSSVPLSSLVDITREISKLTAQADIDFEKQMSQFSRQADRANAMSSLLAGIGDTGINDGEVSRLMQQVQSEVNIDRSLASGDNKEVGRRISSVKKGGRQQDKRIPPEKELEARLAELQDKSVKDVRSRIEEIEREKQRRNKEEEKAVSSRKGIFEDLNLKEDLEKANRKKDGTAKEKEASKSKPLSTEEGLITAHIERQKTLVTTFAIAPSTPPDVQSAMLNYANKLSVMKGIAKTAKSAPKDERSKIWGVIVRGLKTLMKSLQKLSSLAMSAFRTAGNESVKHLESVTSAQPQDKQLSAAKDALMGQYKAYARLKGLTEERTTKFLAQQSASVQEMSSHVEVCEGIYKATKSIGAAGREAILARREELMARKEARSGKSSISPDTTPPVKQQKNELKR